MAIKTIISITVLCVLIGCAQRIGDFTIISTKNYESKSVYKFVGRFSGSDDVFFFIIPWGNPNIKNAVDKAIEAGGGVYLTNAVLESTSAPFQIGYRITGDVYAVASTSEVGVELFELQQLDGKKYLVSSTGKKVELQ